MVFPEFGTLDPLLIPLDEGGAANQTIWISTMRILVLYLSRPYFPSCFSTLVANWIVIVSVISPILTLKKNNELMYFSDKKIEPVGEKPECQFVIIFK